MYKSLQAGRAVAAILVVLFHLGGAISVDKNFGIKEFSIPFIFGGSAGVYFFFVLSGFIILSAHRSDIFQPSKLSNYIKKRFSRIYPTYWIIFLTVYFLALASPTLRNTVPHDALTILKSLLLIPQDSNVVGGNGAPVLIVAWTLQYEVFFYACFALLILNRWLSIVAGTAIFCLYIYGNAVTSPSFLLSFFAKDYTLLFTMGMAVSVACASKNVIAHNPLIYFLIGIVMFSFIALDILTGVNLLSQRNTILFGIASCLIIFGLVKAEDSGRIIGDHSLLQLLGDSSYALYLIHFPMISILCKFYVSIHLNKAGVLGAVFAYCTIFSMCLISSVLFHIWVEKPVNAFFRAAFKTVNRTNGR